MVWLFRLAILICVCVLVPGTFLAVAQDEVPNPTEGYEFFSGTITDLPPGKITVSRTVLGKPPETRTFVITPDTKIEGKLRPKVRVTVGFKAGEEGDLAMRIIVRPQNGKK